MNRILAISFMIIYLVSATELSELMKLPVLVHHYLEHKHEQKHLSILSFLKEHYAELHATKNSHHSKDHTNIPFKTCDHNFSAGNSYTPPLGYNCMEPSGYHVVRTVPFTKEPFFYSLFSVDIWQPPKA